MTTKFGMNIIKNIGTWITMGGVLVFFFVMWLLTWVCLFCVKIFNSKKS